MTTITNIEQLGFSGQDVRVRFADGRRVHGHATMRADSDLIDLWVPGGTCYAFALTDGSVAEVTCGKDLDD
jgi:hypothetical protein